RADLKCHQVRWPSKHTFQLVPAMHSSRVCYACPIGLLNALCPSLLPWPQPGPAHLGCVVAAAAGGRVPEALTQLRSLPACLSSCVLCLSKLLLQGTHLAGCEPAATSITTQGWGTTPRHGHGVHGNCRIGPAARLHWHLSDCWLAALLSCATRVEPAPAGALGARLQDTAGRVGPLQRLGWQTPPPPSEQTPRASDEPPPPRLALRSLACPPLAHLFEIEAPTAGCGPLA
ncbi:hypothetical protein V8C86DRAFT_2826835, partial [Haematococcus lacustris]